LIKTYHILLIIFKFLHIISNCGIVLESKFTVIVFSVLYCTNPLKRMIILLLAILRLVHLLSLKKKKKD